MKSLISPTLICYAGLVTAQNNATNAPNATSCVSGAHVIVARGSYESPGYGILGSVKDRILALVPNSNAVAVPYPATITGNILYIESEPEGVGNLTQLVKAYSDACPGRKMVLMGYSQGAHVVGDTLIGSDYLAFGSFPMTSGLDQRYIDNVAAVVLMGDPANVAGLPINKGNSTHSGFFPRNNTAKWASTGLVNKTVSYCDANDTYCDSGSSLLVHISYVSKYGVQAADWVAQKFMANSSNASSTSTTSKPSSASSTASQSAASSTGSSSGATPLVTGLSTYLMAQITLCVLVAGSLYVI